MTFDVSTGGFSTIDISTIDELIRRVVAWTINSMPTKVSDIATAIYE